MKYQKKFSKELLDLLQELSNDEKKFHSFLLDILTPTEYKELAMRWQIVKKISRGDAQRKIAEDLGVGIATVSRGSRQLSEGSGGFKKALELIEKK